MIARITRRAGVAVAFAGWSLACADTALCQQPSGASDSLAVQDSAGSRRTTIIPFPFVFYTPETDVGFGAMLATLFRLSENESEDQPSSVSPVFVYTLKRQIIASVSPELYLRDGALRVSGEVTYERFPNTLWGVGNETPDTLEEDYTPRTFNAGAELQRRVAPGWYLGGAIRFEDRKLVEVEEGRLLDTGAVPGTGDGQVVSGGALVTWDTRDNTVYPRAGGYRVLQVSVSNSAFGSDHNFTRCTLDVRQYAPVLGTHVVALRGLGIAAGGTSPFDHLAQLGGEDLLRGYYGGRYRDRSLLAFQIEYRVPIWWRIGAVGFAEAGQVSHDLGEFRFAGFKPAAGFGLRFLLSPSEGLNLRADFGFGNGTSGFYLGMGEVF